MKRLIPFFPILIFLSLALAGCTFAVSTEVFPDGSGELRLEIGITPADQAQLAEMGTTVEEFCRAELTAAGNLLQVSLTRVEQRGVDIWCVTEVPFATLEEFQQILSAGEEIFINELSLTPERFTYELSVDLRDVEFFSELVFPDAIQWSLLAPGTLAGHNADEVQGQTLIWRLKQGTLRTLRAETIIEAPTLTLYGLPPLVFYALALGGLCLVGLIGMVGLVWFVLRRRRQS
jgi:hypothetical protein